MRCKHKLSNYVVDDYFYSIKKHHNKNHIQKFDQSDIVKERGIHFCCL